MLKLLSLAACIIGFILVGPKALAEFRRARPRNDAPPHPVAKPDDSEGQQKTKRQAA